MPRRIRKQSKSKIYHVMVRGNERKNLFIDEEDMSRFVDILYYLAGDMKGEGIKSPFISPAFLEKKEKKFYIHAYCLMDNHIHLLINEGEDEISRIMKRIGTRYAYYFNKKYHRVGHLFQDRFKSEPIEDDAYLLTAVKYIHYNPVKACMVKHPAEYTWSSYNEYIKEDRGKGFIDKDFVLGMLSDNRKRAAELFAEQSNLQSENGFIEYEELEENKTLVSEKYVKYFIDQYLSGEGMEISQINDKEKSSIRNELIRELKLKSNLSIRQIADILGVNRGVVQRIIP
jgi:putative transposase